MSHVRFGLLDPALVSRGGQVPCVSKGMALAGELFQLNLSTRG